MTCGWRSFRGNVANLMLNLQVALAEGSGQFKSVSSKLGNDGLSTVLEVTRAWVPAGSGSTHIGLLASSKMRLTPQMDTNYRYSKVRHCTRGLCAALHTAR